MTDLRFFIRDQPYGMGWTLNLVALNQDGSLEVAQPIEFKHVGKEEPSGTAETPMLPINTFNGVDQSLQSLMDELWRVGIRPKDIGTAGHLSATQKHLEDMRAIVFSKIEVPIPCSS